MDAEAYAIARRCAQRVHSNPGASLLGGGGSSIEWATFVNGLLIRYLDYNDTYLSLEPAHPSDNLAPVLAVGEAFSAGGKELITAAVLAYEIQCRLCDAASLRKHGWDHVFYGALSSCAAACKLMKLDVVKTTHALGLAGVCNTALRQTRAGELSMWKGCAFANAARNGVFAALLAAEGMTGPAPIFEGDLGFMKLVTRAPFVVAPLGGEQGGHQNHRAVVERARRVDRARRGDLHELRQRDALARHQFGELLDRGAELGGKGLRVHLARQLRHGGVEGMLPQRRDR